MRRRCRRCGLSRRRAVVARSRTTRAGADGRFRPGRVSRALQGAGRNQHDAVRRQLHGRSQGHGGATRGRRSAAGRHAGARTGGSAQRRRVDRHAPGAGSPGQADSAAGARRRRRSEARRLGARSLQARRGGRLVLRARRQRRQGDGRGVHRQPDPLSERRLQAAPRHQAGADVRRGNTGDVQQRPLADPDAPRRAAGGVRPQRRRGRRARFERQADHVADPGRREGLPGLHARNDQCGRAQCAAAEGQRHLSAGCRIVAVVGLDSFRSASILSRAAISKRKRNCRRSSPPTFGPC